MNCNEYVQFRHVSKVFPGCQALDDVSFSIKKGEVHALLGENGAGKTTLLNILHGAFQPSGGEVFIDGERINFHSTYDAIKFGISKVHQELNMVPEMTVAQNIMLGCEPQKGILLDYKKMNRDTAKLLERLKSSLSPDEKVGKLSAGEMQIIQIAKALHMNSRVISFDEPTASLSSNETETLFEIIRELKEKGITIIYTSHRLDEVFRIAESATILRDGKYINTNDIKELTKEKLIYNMIGRDVSMFAVRKKPTRADPGIRTLEVKNLCIRNVFDDISFYLNRGEILGFFGLVGSKRTDVMRAIFGADRITGGEIYVNGKKTLHDSPRKGVKDSMGLIPEERKLQGFIRNLSNSDNIALPSLRKFVRLGIINHREKKENGRKLAHIVGLKPPDPDFPTNNLSGGNQQKVILAKWLSTGADIMIFDEPTKGIDIGAKTEIYNLMESLVEKGKSIIMVSSELPEIIGISDRLIVMREGRIAAEFSHSEFNEKDILSYALGGNNQ